MTIRGIAKELYRMRKEVERLEDELSAVSPERRREIEDKLRKAKAEKKRLEETLEGSKEPSPTRRPL